MDDLTLPRPCGKSKPKTPDITKRRVQSAALRLAFIAEALVGLIDDLDGRLAQFDDGAPSTPWPPCRRAGAPR